MASTCPWISRGSTTMHCANTRMTKFYYEWLQQVTHSQGRSQMRKKPLHESVISILHCDFPGSQNWLRVAGQKTLPNMLRGCEKLGCRNDRSWHTRDLPAAPANVRNSGWCGLNVADALWAVFTRCGSRVGQNAVMHNAAFFQRCGRV